MKEIIMEILSESEFKKLESVLKKKNIKGELTKKYLKWQIVLGYSQSKKTGGIPTCKIVQDEESPKYFNFQSYGGNVKTITKDELKAFLISNFELWS